MPLKTRPSPEARAALAAAARSIPLSGRGIDKVRRVALTIACLEEAATVGEDHVCEALALRGGGTIDFQRPLATVNHRAGDERDRQQIGDYPS